MTTSFKLLLELTIKHSYFPNSICDGLIVTPTKLTNDLFKNYGFKINQKIGGIQVYANTTEEKSTFLNYIKSAQNMDAFEFGIQTNDNMDNSVQLCHFNKIPELHTSTGTKS